MNELKELKKLRSRIGITQAELANKASVSQSLIAKIESDKIDPSYSNARKIIDTLTELGKESELTAKDIMYNKVIYAKSTDTIKYAINQMRNKNISQMPVMKNNKIVGYISESILLDKILKGETQSKVGEIMESSPPIMPPDTSQSVIANLLKYFPFVLIKEKENIIGIITKVDLLKVVY